MLSMSFNSTSLEVKDTLKAYTEAKNMNLTVSMSLKEVIIVGQPLFTHS